MFVSVNAFTCVCGPVWKHAHVYVCCFRKGHGISLNTSNGAFSIYHIIILPWVDQSLESSTGKVADAVCGLADE